MALLSSKTGFWHLPELWYSRNGEPELFLCNILSENLVILGPVALLHLLHRPPLVLGTHLRLASSDVTLHYDARSVPTSSKTSTLSSAPQLTTTSSASSVPVRAFASRQLVVPREARSTVRVAKNACWPVPTSHGHLCRTRSRPYWGVAAVVGTEVVVTNLQDWLSRRRSATAIWWRRSTTDR